jgi:nucleotide-binding universal stress UspA family protein
MVPSMAQQRTHGRPEIIVGVDGSPRSEDALSFASRLAAVGGANLALLAAFAPGDRPRRPAENALREHASDVTRKTLMRTRGLVDSESVTTHAIADRSPARALHALAERDDAALIVVGSTHRGRVGRVLPGGTADRLLHRAPCPVAIVPIDYRKRSREHMTSIGVGYDGTQESRAALNAAAQIARALAASLRVVRVFDAAWDATPALMASGHGYVAVHRRLQRRAREDLERLLAGLPEATVAEAVFPPGRPPRELVTQSAGVDLLVLGARGQGPLRAVLSGSVSHIVVRDAACPVIVVPRAGRATLSELFSQPSVLDEARIAGAHPAFRAVRQAWTSPRRIA